ncbi:MAG: DUF3943 domain-containing protein [bacterium]|nr:DUF3943 domain-containing protein [bacterium]
MVAILTPSLYAESNEASKKENSKENSLQDKALNPVCVKSFKLAKNYASCYLYAMPMCNWNLCLNKIPHSPDSPSTHPHLSAVKPYKPEKKWGRTILEGLGHFVYATSSYWIRQDVMKEDWEYQFTWKDQKRRFLFLDGPRFDSNSFQFNWTHSGAGAIYYNYARTNRLNSAESFLFSLGASTFWEFVIEFREVVSINDMIGTPMGGLSIGESLFQVSRVFRDQKPSLLNDIACFLSNPIMTLNNWLDRKKPFTKIYAGAADYWHDFRLHAGPRSSRLSSSDSRVQGVVGFESQVIALKEYGKPGFVAGNAGSTISTQFDFSFGINNNGIDEFSIFAKSVLFGYINQHINGNDYDKRKGYSLLLGMASNFEMFKKSNAITDYIAPEREDEIAEEAPGESSPPAFDTDKLCIIGLFGPSADFTVFHNKLKLRLIMDAYFDFALVHSAAYAQYSSLYEVTNTKSTLLNHAYYYALGLTASSSFQLNYANLELVGKLKYHYFNSVEGLDRFQKDMAHEDDFPLKDSRLNYYLGIGYTIPKTPLQLSLGYESMMRKGWLEDFYRSHKESRSYFQVKLLF